jgi:hypothetical protein
MLPHEDYMKRPASDTVAMGIISLLPYASDTRDCKLQYQFDSNVTLYYVLLLVWVNSPRVERQQSWTENKDLQIVTVIGNVK